MRAAKEDAGRRTDGPDGLRNNDIGNAALEIALSSSSSSRFGGIGLGCRDHDVDFDLARVTAFHGSSRFYSTVYSSSIEGELLQDSGQVLLA